MDKTHVSDGRRSGVSLAFAAMAPLLAALSAHATYVQKNTTTARIEITGDPGDNHIQVELTSLAGPVRVIEYNQSITAGPGCTKTGLRVVECEFGVARDAWLGEGSDIYQDNGIVYLGYYNFVDAGPGVDDIDSYGPLAVFGGDGGDFLKGGVARDTFTGQILPEGQGPLLGGHNSLIGGNGNDVIDGGSRNDYLEGGPGADTLRGNDGNSDYLKADDGQADSVIKCGGGSSDTAVKDANDPAPIGCEIIQ